MCLAPLPESYRCLLDILVFTRKDKRLRVGISKFSQHWVLKRHVLQTCSHMSIDHVHIGMLTLELFALAWQLLNGKLSKLLVPIKMIVKD